MNNALLAVGMILKEPAQNKRWRVIAIAAGVVVLFEMDTTKFCRIEYMQQTILVMMADQTLIREEEVRIFDADRLPPDMRSDFERKRDMMYEVIRAYGPLFRELSGKRPKLKLREIVSEYHYSIATSAAPAGREI